jgi:malonyl-CoA O-methyltransferase
MHLLSPHSINVTLEQVDNVLLRTQLAGLTKRAIKLIVRRQRLPFSHKRRLSYGTSDIGGLPSPKRAIEWIRRHESEYGGILAHSSSALAYPEVTGYLVPTLLRYGERELATRLVRWLLCTQRADGSYTSPEGTPYVFDTGQALRGLLVAEGLVSGTLEASSRAASYLCSQMVEGGKGGFGLRYSGSIPESVHLYVLPALCQAAESLCEPQYRIAAERCLEYYLTQNALKVGTLTHFLGYELEALIDLRREDLTRPVLDALSQEQATDGSVRGADRSSWVCSPGLAQLAICWYKIGQWQPADKAMEWLDAHQRPSGGFLGSYGPKSSYFPDAELSWATKFYLDAHLLRVMSFYERNADVLLSPIGEKDRRLQAICSLVKPNDRILEVGFGKTPFSKPVHQNSPRSAIAAVPVFPSFGKYAFEGIRTLSGSPESVPCPDNDADVVFSVEVLDYCANWEAALTEMIRVARPGGWVVVIVRDDSRQRENVPPWRGQPDGTRIRSSLSRECDDVTAELIQCKNGPAVVWRGRKRSKLSGPEWNRVLYSENARRVVVDRVRHNMVSEWGQVVISNTSAGQRVLEIGSGTGEISLQLAQAGRIVTALDFSPDSLRFIRHCAQELDIPITTKLADATRHLPFPDNAFDCTWSSGLLEHFSSEERQSMLREWARVTSGKVISLVPNAACVAYRAGKAMQEEQGKWPYGVETPILSMWGDFEAAGLYLTSEYSVGVGHALSFLPTDHPLRSSLFAWMERITERELQDCNQGYLLVSIGSKGGVGGKCSSF